MIRTRFAPSPTGNLHVGSVRTALFSWLFAKAKAGEFILRIEDTDRERSTEASSEAIVAAMHWLGLTTDEAPIYQSDRFERYQAVAERLLATGKAYRCVCSHERLEKMREAQLAAKEKPRYDGCCREKSLQDPAGVIRFKTPKTGEISFNDLVYGPITVANAELDDLVLIRADGVPTYNFAVVVDDADMSITHVIRGDDHINNTPRQIHLFEALGWSLPQFAHLPMILGGDSKRLSKRHGAVNVLEFRDAGFLPQALLNYLVRLGWSHHDQEIFSLEEMMRYFDLAQVSRSPACFDYEKLSWLNQHYMKTMPAAVVAAELQWQFDRMNICTKLGPDLQAIVRAMAERCKTLKEMAEKSRCYVEDVLIYDQEAVSKYFQPQILEPFNLLLSKLEALESWEKEKLHEVIAQVCETLSLKMGAVAQPLRVAMTGSSMSPSIDETLLLVGRERALQRLKDCIHRTSEPRP